MEAMCCKLGAVIKHNEYFHIFGKMFGQAEHDKHDR